MKDLFTLSFVTGGSTATPHRAAYVDLPLRFAEWTINFQPRVVYSVFN